MACARLKVLGVGEQLDHISHCEEQVVSKARVQERDEDRVV